MTGNSNILHALSASGGVGEFGSYREINLLRNNKVIETLDLYELLIGGQYNLRKRLRSGDVIFVEPRKAVVSIDGAVKRLSKMKFLIIKIYIALLNLQMALKIRLIYKISALKES